MIFDWNLVFLYWFQIDWKHRQQNLNQHFQEDFRSIFPEFTSNVKIYISFPHNPSRKLILSLIFHPGGHAFRPATPQCYGSQFGSRTSQTGPLSCSIHRAQLGSLPPSTEPDEGDDGGGEEACRGGGGGGGGLLTLYSPYRIFYVVCFSTGEI